MERGVESVGREDEGGDGEKGKEAGYTEVRQKDGKRWGERVCGGEGVWRRGCVEERVCGGEGVWRRGCVEKRRMGGNSVRLVCSCTR